MENVMIFGTPIAFGVFVSGVAQWIKVSPLFPFVEKGHPLVIRLVVAALALGLQTVFSLSQGGAFDWNFLFDSFVTYVTASASYVHIFKPLSKKEGN